MTKPNKPEDRAPETQAENPDNTSPVARLEHLAREVESARDPNTLVMLADELDRFGRTIALEIASGSDDVHLKRVLSYVPTLQGQALLRAAERFDDRGSPKRAAYVLFEALRTAFDASVILTVAEALSFILEANDQPAPAVKLRELVVAREAQRVSGSSLSDVRARFTEAITDLRDRGVTWDALEDPDELFD